MTDVSERKLMFTRVLIALAVTLTGYKKADQFQFNFCQQYLCLKNVLYIKYS